MEFDRQAFERARQAAREEYLKKKTAQRQAAAQSAVIQTVEDLERGTLTLNASEAERLLQRTKEVKVAKELVEVAKARSGLEQEDGSPASEQVWSEASLPASPITTASPTHTSGVNEYIVHESVEKKVAGTDALAEAVQLPDVTKPPEEPRASLQKQRQSLPIYSVRDELLQLIKQNPVIVVVGETGSGKTTQLLQYIYEEGLHVRRPTEEEKSEGSGGTSPQELKLVCTQPRRIAAISVAERVAVEVGCRCGSVVGYKVRFDDKSGPHTAILFVTDGVMLREFISDPNLENVAAIMIDEAHERSLNSDILLGLLRDLVRRNSRIRVIVASATINADKFSQFFGGAPVFCVSGRTYPVEMFYTEESVADYVVEAAETAMGIHLTKPLPGDILIFLPGQDSIEACVEVLRRLAEEEEQMRPLLVLPIFSSLPPKEQARIYEPAPPGTRKVVVATNIAETSITIDGVVYVLDCGLCKQNYYNPRAMTEELRVVPISKASAMQRSGRAGRTQAGECFRLYTRFTFQNELPPDSVPEVLRCSMCSVVLQLKVLGIDNLLQFDFLDAPSTASLEIALDQLFLLGAMKADGRLTVTGRRMAELPLEPSWSKALIRASKLGCARHVAMAASMLTLETVFLNSREPRTLQNIESAKDVFFSYGNGDVAGYVNLMETWLRCGSSSAAMEFCRTYSVQWRSMVRARDVLDQILGTMQRIGLELDTAAPSPEDEGAPASGRTLDVEKLTKSLLSGFFYNVSRLEMDKRRYIVIRPLETSLPGGGAPEDGDGSAEIHPTSFLFRSGMVKERSDGKAIAPVLRERPFLVFFTALRHTTKRFMINITAIQSVEWVLESAPENYFERDMLEDTTTRRKRIRD